MDGCTRADQSLDNSTNVDSCIMSANTRKPSPVMNGRECKRAVSGCASRSRSNVARSGQAGGESQAAGALASPTSVALPFVSESAPAEAVDEVGGLPRRSAATAALYVEECAGHETCSGAASSSASSACSQWVMVGDVMAGFEAGTPRAY
ncbi:hypothetical protein EON62_04580 [archaeon]|nr:MAG: hypothetical protein EON62_04580 [archaeon]